MSRELHWELYKDAYDYTFRIYNRFRGPRWDVVGQQNRYLYGITYTLLHCSAHLKWGIYQFSMYVR